MTDLIGKKVIARGDRSGVFFGTIVDKNGQEIELKDARNIWYWDGAAGLNEIAVKGIGKPDNSKVTVSVDSIILTDVIEILIPTERAIANLEMITAWRA